MDGSRNENMRSRFTSYPIGNMQVERYDTEPINKQINQEELNRDKRSIFLISSKGRVAIAKSECGKEKGALVFMSPATSEDDQIDISDEEDDASEYLHFFEKEKSNDYNYNLTKTIERILCNYKEYIFDVLKILKVEGETGSRIFLRLKKRISDRPENEDNVKIAITKKSKNKQNTVAFSMCRYLLFFLSLLFTACYAAFVIFIYYYRNRCITLPLDKFVSCVLKRDVEIDF